MTSHATFDFCRRNSADSSRSDANTFSFAEETCSIRLCPVNRTAFPIGYRITVFIDDWRNPLRTDRDGRVKQYPQFWHPTTNSTCDDVHFAVVCGNGCGEFLSAVNCGTSAQTEFSFKKTPLTSTTAIAMSLEAVRKPIRGVLTIRNLVCLRLTAAAFELVAAGIRIEAVMMSLSRNSIRKRHSTP